MLKIGGREGGRGEGGEEEERVGEGRGIGRGGRGEREGDWERWEGDWERWGVGGGGGLGGGR